MIDFTHWKSTYDVEPGRLGVSDCCLALADWAVANGYADGADWLRGTYSEEAEMYAKIAQYGDIVGLVTHCADLAGVSVASKRSYGSIAVIGSKTNMYRQWGAIWDGVRWQVRLKDGFIGLSAPAIKIWTV